MSGDTLGLKIGDRLTIKGASVFYPYNTFTYEITSFSRDYSSINLKIVESKLDERKNLGLQ